MKRIFLIIMVLLYIMPQSIKAQSDGLAVAAGALVAIGATVAAVEQMKERAELTATEWVLSHQPNLVNFSLKTLDFDGKKLKDISGASVITFKIQEFTPADKPALNGRKQVLFGFTSQGWISEYGINFEKVNWHLIDSQEWINMMTSYVKVASDEKDENTIQEVLLDGKIVNKGVRLKNKMTIPFYKLSGDMYVVTDYSPDMKLLYNERSLGIYIKQTMDLVQISRGSIIEIHDFFFDE